MGEFLEVTHDKFIFRVKEGYWYSRDDFWVNPEGSAAVVGITDFLQKARGDVAFLETVEPGTAATVGDELGTIETIKATFGIVCPVSGRVDKVNSELEASPFLINQDPYGTGWIYEVGLSNWDVDKRALLSAPEYLELLKEKIAREMEKK